MQIESISSNVSVDIQNKVSKSGGGFSFSEILRQASQNNIEKTPKGYAYVDKYGFSHVVAAYETAVEFVKPNTEIYGYHGKFEGGYATDYQNSRMALPLPESVPYGNDNKKETSKVENTVTLEHLAVDTVDNKVPAVDDFLAEYPGALSLLPPNYNKINFNMISESDWFNNEES